MYPAQKVCFGDVRRVDFPGVGEELAEEPPLFALSGFGAVAEEKLFD